MLPSSTAQQLREDLGRRLRDVRLSAGIKGRALAEMMGRHPSKISRIENGAATPSPADIRAWCQHCGANDQLEDLLAALRTVEGVLIEYERLEVGGFESSQQRILPMYSTTTTFRAYSSWIIPGILQTEAYTRAVWRLLIERRGIEDDIDDAMPARLARQRALHDKRRRFVFLLEESVLRTGFGGPEVMLDQLGRLLAVSTMSNVALGILPMSPSRKAWPVEDFWIFDDERVEVELVSSHLRYTTRRDISMYVEAFNALRDEAVYGSNARALISSAVDLLDSRKVAQDY